MSIERGAKERLMMTLGKLFKWATLTLITLLVFAVIIGIIYQNLSEARDLDRFPPPGRLFEVDGSLMHIHCQGIESPTVLVEQGLGFYSSSWDNINSEIAKVTRVCAYDRVGMGYSEPVTRTLSHADVISRLAKLLDAAGEYDDLVLVGYSAGGVYVREFQRRHPERVIGMVLVDSSHEQQDSRLPSLPNNATPSDINSVMEIAQYLAPTGIFRLTGLVKNQVDGLSIDRNLREKILTQYEFSHSIAAQLNEIKSFRDDPEKTNAPTSLGDLPLSVITQGAPITLPENSPGYITIEFLQEQRLVWQTLQEELAGLSTNSEHIVAAMSGHSIYFDEPELLVDSVIDTVVRAREYREGTHNNQFNQGQTAARFAH